MLEQIANNRCFDGEQRRYRHRSEALNCDMTFSVYLPPQALAKKGGTVPVLYWLSGLTCTDENFVQKAGAQRYAAEEGIVLVAPDTSPRGDGVPDDPQGGYDLGLGAGFYLNATQQPWGAHYRMYDYVRDELPRLINDNFPVDIDLQSISGHSMGGHGALTIALKNPGKFRSVSAFAPICAPTQCPWGQKAFSTYLGDDHAAWLEYDASYLITKAREDFPLLIDQGDDDQFLTEQLMPEQLLDAAKKSHFAVDYHLRPGYDHSYFFIASFIGDHIRFQARNLNEK